MNKNTKNVRVTIESHIGEEKLVSESRGHYLFKDGAHLVTYTDYTGNAVTRNGMEVREERMLLHRTGTFAGDMLFDPFEDTLFKYNAFVVNAEFILHTEVYELMVSDEGIRIRLKYLLRDDEGQEVNRGDQIITVIFSEEEEDN